MTACDCLAEAYGSRRGDVYLNEVRPLVTARSVATILLDLWLAMSGSSAARWVWDRVRALEAPAKHFGLLVESSTLTRTALTDGCRFTSS
jgi:hypothetical protein